MATAVQVYDWASVVLSNNCIKMMPPNNRQDVLHNLLEPLEVAIIVDHDKFILDGPWDNILKSKVTLSEYFFALQETYHQLQSTEPVMGSSSLSDIDMYEVLADDALEITNEETLAETLSVYETAMLLKYPASADFNSGENKVEKSSPLSNAEKLITADSKDETEDISNLSKNENSHVLKKNTISGMALEEKIDFIQMSDCDSKATLSNCDEKSLYVTIAVSPCHDVFQNVMEKLRRSPSPNLDDIAGDEMFTNDGIGSSVSEIKRKCTVQDKLTTRPSGHGTLKGISQKSLRLFKKGYRIVKKQCYVEEVVKTDQLSQNMSTSKSNIKGEMFELQSDFKFSCSKCSLKTNQKTYYLKHMKLHEKNCPVFPCDQCDYKTVGRTALGRHKQQHTNLGLCCEVCNFRTNELERLEKHKLSKHRTGAVQRIFECISCSYNTTVRYQIKQHVHEHTADENAVFQCQQCPYTSLYKMQLSRHIKSVHLNIRPYLCDTCGKKFKRQDTLKKHSYLHRPTEQRLSCPICAKIFATSEYLASHMISHTKERPYLCEICGASFKMQATQRSHVALVHNNPGGFSCSNCGRKFNRKFTMIRHMKTHCAQTTIPAQATLTVQSSINSSEQMTLIATHNIIEAGSLQAGTIVLQDPSQATFESQPSLTVMEGQLADGTITVLRDVEEAYEISQGETATALLYLPTPNNN